MRQLLHQINLNQAEKNIIKKVSSISFVLCISIVIVTAIIQRLSLENNVKDTESIQNETVIQSRKNTSVNSGKPLLTPIDIEAHKIAVEHAHNTSKPTEAIAHLIRIISVENENRKAKLQLATLYYKIKEYEKAEKIFHDLLDEEIQDTLLGRTMARFGFTLFLSGKIEQSISQLDSTISLFPDEAEAYIYRGHIAAYLDRSDDTAERLFKKALKLDPDNLQPLYHLARFYMNKPAVSKEDYLKTRQYLLRLIEKEPLCAKYHARLGMVYYYLEQFELAKKSYQTALLLNEHDFNTHYNLGELYYTFFKDSKKAAQEFTKTIELKNDHVEAHFKIGLIALDNNMAKEAINHFKTALQHAPRNIRILLQLAVAYEKINMKEEAVATYNSILDLDILNDIAQQKIKLLNCGS